MRWYGDDGVTIRNGALTYHEIKVQMISESPPVQFRHFSALALSGEISYFSQKSIWLELYFNILFLRVNAS